MEKHKQKKPAEEVDSVLVKLAQAGQSKAFDILVLRYQQRIMARVLRSVKNPNDVADITQDVFLKAWRGLPKFRGESSFYTWLFRIALNTIANYLDGKSRRPPDHDLAFGVEDSYLVEYETSTHDTPEGEVLAEETRVTLNRALASMHCSLRNALLLREMHGLSYADIATTLGCPVGTVRSRIFRARDYIDRALQANTKVQADYADCLGGEKDSA